jgi:hypothetical protein
VDSAACLDYMHVYPGIFEAHILFRSTLVLRGKSYLHVSAKAHAREELQAISGMMSCVWKLVYGRWENIASNNCKRVLKVQANKLVGRVIYLNVDSTYQFSISYRCR